MVLTLDDGLRINDFVERQRHVDKADTTLAGHIPDKDLASVRPDGLPSDGESKAKPGPIGAASIAKLLKQISLTRRNAATLIFDLDEQPPILGARPQHDAPP